MIGGETLGYSDGFPSGGVTRRDIQHHLTVPVIGTQPLAHVNRSARYKFFRIDRANDFDAAIENIFDFEAAGDVVPVLGGGAGPDRARVRARAR